MTHAAGPSVSASVYAYGASDRPPAKLAPSPICMVDVHEMYILSSSQAWTDIDLIMPRDHHLLSVVHPDEVDRVHEFLVSAPAVPETKPARTVVRMKGVSGWRATKLAALRLAGLVDGQQIMIRLS